MKARILSLWGLLAVACQSKKTEHSQPTSTNKARLAADTSRLLARQPAQLSKPISSPSKDATLAPSLSFAQARTSNFYTGKLADINYRSHVIARRYRTVLTAGYWEGRVNFGGHYRLVTWMCGAPCAQSALVDARTGCVYEGPIAAMGFSFRADSRLLISNPPDSSGLDNPLFPPEYWVWHEAHCKFERP